MYSAIGRSIVIVPRRLSGFSSLRAAPNPVVTYSRRWARRSVYQVSNGWSLWEKGGFAAFFSLIKICYGSAGLFRLNKI